MACLLPFDEINKLVENIARRNGGYGKLGDYLPVEDIIDEMLDLFLLAYASGVEQANNDLGTNVVSESSDAEETINAVIAGQTWEERVRDYLANGGTVEDLQRIAETESHRDYATGAHETAKSAGATYKKWITMRDEKVRDTHSFIDGVAVGIDEEFYTYDGDSALYPGGFENADNNINCRCWLEYSA